jgi:methionine-rich copper-binding protein CopC
MMITLTNLKKMTFATVICAVLSVAVVGCSDDKSDFDPMDQSKIKPVPDKEKIEFEHKFADQCVTRELKNSQNSEADNAGLENTCLCVSKYLMKNLTEQEAEKFLEDDENPESLVIKYDAAAYHCLQENQPKGPDFSKK